MEIINRNPKIYIICGKARSGKDTIASYIKKTYEEKGQRGVSIAYADHIKNYAKIITNWDGSDETKPRELLQNLGTEVIREQIDQSFFVNRMTEDIKVYAYFFKAIIISDARYADEIDVIKERFKDAVSIHITRPNFTNELTDMQKTHLSETGLDHYTNYDYVISNDGTIADLEAKIKKIMLEVGHED